MPRVSERGTCCTDIKISKKRQNYKRGRNALSPLLRFYILESKCYPIIEYDTYVERRDYFTKIRFDFYKIFEYIFSKFMKT